MVTGAPIRTCNITAISLSRRYACIDIQCNIDRYATSDLCNHGCYTPLITLYAIHHYEYMQQQACRSQAINQRPFTTLLGGGGSPSPCYHVSHNATHPLLPAPSPLSLLWPFCHGMAKWARAARSVAVAVAIVWMVSAVIGRAGAMLMCSGTSRTLVRTHSTASECARRRSLATRGTHTQWLRRFAVGGAVEQADDPSPRV